MVAIFLIAILVLLWIVLFTRIRRLEASHADGVTRAEFAAITERVFLLEHPGGRPARPAPTREPEPAPVPLISLTPATPLTGEQPPVEPPPIEEQQARVTPPPIFTAYKPFAASAPPRREWETLIGGSVLNAAGGIILVIGIALFLAYSFSHMTPAGRAALAAIASAAILFTGVWAELKRRYRTFARGLIGAGWAALYATSYAIYAVPAARVITNGAAGSLLQLAVAAGMVAHSLRYRSQWVTAIAYSAVFAALAVMPSTPFAAASLIPIAASVLYLASRFDWDALPLFGITATYLTCISHGQSDAPLAATQSLLLVYWLIFELFDLRRVKLGRVRQGLEFLFPLNATGFLGLSYIAWGQHAPDRLWLAAAAGAALYLASSIARALLHPRSESHDMLQRLREGGYEASLAVASLLAMLAIFGKSSGVWSAAALACEAELLFVAGLRFDSSFIRGFAGALFGCSLLRLALVLPDGFITVAGHDFHEYTPVLLFHAALFYVNRALRRSAILYSHLASALVTLVLLAETPYYAIALSLALFGFVLLGLSTSGARQELRPQAYLLLLLGVAASCIDLLLHIHGIWWSHAAVIAVLLLCAVLVRHLPGIAGWFVFGASICAAVLFWRTLPHDAVALAWAAIGFALAAASNQPALSRLNQQAPFFTFAAVITACVADVHPARLGISIPCAALFYSCQFVQRRTGEPLVQLYYSMLGTFLVVTILFGRVTGGMLTVSWGLLGLALLGSGFAARERFLRLEGLALLLVCILKLFFYDLRNLETLYRILSFVALGLILLSVSWIYTRFRDQITRLL